MGQKRLMLSIDKTGKDQGKANYANAYIGFAVPNRLSSTETYFCNAKQQGIPVNDEIKPNSDTVAFVSVASEGIFVEQTAELALRVIEHGGTVVMDRPGTGFGESHSRFNVNGEGKVQDLLGKPDGFTPEGYAVWGNMDNIRKITSRKIEHRYLEIKPLNFEVVKKISQSKLDSVDNVEDLSLIFERAERGATLDIKTIFRHLCYEYMAQCGCSRGYRTVIYDCAWSLMNYLAAMGKIEIAENWSFSDYIEHAFPQWGKIRHCFKEYDVCKLEHRQYVELGFEMIRQCSENQNKKDAFAYAFLVFIASDELADIYKHNKKARVHNSLLDIEKRIRFYTSIKFWEKTTDVVNSLEELLYERKILLNKLFCGTEAEMVRFCKVNKLLLDLTRKMYRKMATVYRPLLVAGKDPDFDDDYNLEGALNVYYNDESSVLTLENDDNYPSDFRRMHEVMSQMHKIPIRTDSKPYNASDTPQQSDEQWRLTDTMEDGDSWIHGCGIYDPSKFNGIVVCNAVHVLCSHNYYSIPDLLRLNDFWCEVKLTCQNIEEQDGTRYCPNEKISIIAKK